MVLCRDFIAYTCECGCVLNFGRHFNDWANAMEFRFCKNVISWWLLAKKRWGIKNFALKRLASFQPVLVSGKCDCCATSDVSSSHNRRVSFQTFANKLMALFVGRWNNNCSRHCQFVHCCPHWKLLGILNLDSMRAAKSSSCHVVSVGEREAVSIKLPFFLRR